MLTPESYQNAWLAYIAATLAAIVILYLWVGPRLSHAARLACAALLAALALTPAHPAANMDSWAPAVVVAGFEMLTDGAEAAMRPLRSLFTAVAMVVAVSLLAWLILRSLRKGESAPPPPEAPNAAPRSTS